MSYNAFVFVLTQLAGKKRARIVVEGHTLFVDAAKKQGRWTLSTKVFDGEGVIPDKVRACVSSCGILRWQEGGAFLKLDPQSHSVFLVEEIDMQEKKYIPFRYYVNHFVSLATEWQGILADFAEQDTAPIFSS